MLKNSCLKILFIAKQTGNRTVRDKLPPQS